MTSRFKVSKKKSRVWSRLNNAKLSSSSHVMSVEGINSVWFGWWGDRCICGGARWCVGRRR